MRVHYGWKGQENDRFGDRGAVGHGKADCEASVAEVAQVIVTDRNGEFAHGVADNIGGDAMPLDVADERKSHEILDVVKERNGGLDVLINNAGNELKEIVEVFSTKNFPLEIDIERMGIFFGCEYAHLLMKHRHPSGGGSSIVTISSLAATSACLFCCKGGDTFDDEIHCNTLSG